MVKSFRVKAGKKRFGIESDTRVKNMSGKTAVFRSNRLLLQSFRRLVRVVEGARLESVYTRKGIEGSNPSVSARDEAQLTFKKLVAFFFVGVWYAVGPI